MSQPFNVNPVPQINPIEFRINVHFNMSCYGKSLLPHLLSIHNHFMGIFTLVIYCLAKQLELTNSPCDM